MDSVTQTLCSSLLFPSSPLLSTSDYCNLDNNNDHHHHRTPPHPFDYHYHSNNRQVKKEEQDENNLELTTASSPSPALIELDSEPSSILSLSSSLVDHHNYHPDCQEYSHKDHHCFHCKIHSKMMIDDKNDDLFSLFTANESIVTTSSSNNHHPAISTMNFNSSNELLHHQMNPFMTNLPIHHHLSHPHGFHDDPMIASGCCEPHHYDVSSMKNCLLDSQHQHQPHHYPSSSSFDASSCQYTSFSSMATLMDDIPSSSIHLKRQDILLSSHSQKDIFSTNNNIIGINKSEQDSTIENNNTAKEETSIIMNEKSKDKLTDNDNNNNNNEPGRTFTQSSHSTPNICAVDRFVCLDELCNDDDEHEQEAIILHGLNRNSLLSTMSSNEVHGDKSLLGNTNCRFPSFNVPSHDLHTSFISKRAITPSIKNTSLALEQLNKNFNSNESTKLIHQSSLHSNTDSVLHSLNSNDNHLSSTYSPNAISTTLRSYTRLGSIEQETPCLTTTMSEVNAKADITPRSSSSSCYYSSAYSTPFSTNKRCQSPAMFSSPLLSPIRPSQDSMLLFEYGYGYAQSEEEQESFETVQHTAKKNVNCHDDPLFSNNMETMAKKNKKKPKCDFSNHVQTSVPLQTEESIFFASTLSPIDIVDGTIPIVEQSNTKKTKRQSNNKRKANIESQGSDKSKKTPSRKSSKKLQASSSSSSTTNNTTPSTLSSSTTTVDNPNNESSEENMNCNPDYKNNDHSINKDTAKSGDEENEYDENKDPEEDMSKDKKRRSQVKVACVHCKKACKKCDEIRPCSRCARLGMSDTCVDAPRKERKKHNVRRTPLSNKKSGIEDVSFASPPVTEGLPLMNPDTHSLICTPGIYSPFPRTSSTKNPVDGGHKVIQRKVKKPKQESKKNQQEKEKQEQQECALDKQTTLPAAELVVATTS